MPPAIDERSLAMQIFLLFSLVIAVLAIVFALQNAAVVTIIFLAWRFDGSLALVILVALGVGALVSLLASLPSLARGSWTIASQKRKVKQLESQITDYQKQLAQAEERLAVKPDLVEEEPEAPSE